MTTTAALFRQRYPRKDNESDEAYDARIQEEMEAHRPGRPLPTSPDAISAQTKRLQRAGVNPNARSPRGGDAR